MTIDAGSQRADARTWRRTVEHDAERSGASGHRPGESGTDSRTSGQRSCARLGEGTRQRPRSKVKPELDERRRPRRAADAGRSLEHASQEAQTVRPRISVGGAAGHADRNHRRWRPTEGREASRGWPDPWLTGCAEERRRALRGPPDHRAATGEPASRRGEARSQRAQPRRRRPRPARVSRYVTAAQPRGR